MRKVTSRGSQRDFNVKFSWFCLSVESVNRSTSIGNVVCQDNFHFQLISFTCHEYDVRDSQGLSTSEIWRLDKTFKKIDAETFDELRFNASFYINAKVRVY